MLPQISGLRRQDMQAILSLLADQNTKPEAFGVRNEIDCGTDQSESINSSGLHFPFHVFILYCDFDNVTTLSFIE